MCALVALPTLLALACHGVELQPEARSYEKPVTDTAEDQPIRPR